MTARKLPLALLLFASTVVAAALAIPAIYIPVSIAEADRFDGKVRMITDDEMADYVESKLKLIGIVPIPLVGWLFLDRRTGKKIRIREGDTLEVRFADGSTMKMTFMGVEGSYYFQSIYNSLRRPGEPLTNPRPGTRGAPIGGGQIGDTPVSPYYHYTGTPDDYGSCLNGDVGLCPVTKGG